MSQTPSETKPNGRAVAAMLAAMIGLLVLGIVHTGTQASSDFNTAVFNVGKAWIPNATGIGPYSGKETFMLIAWFGSWGLLYLSLRNRRVNLGIVTLIFMVGIAVATLLVYTPFIHFMLSK